MHNKYKMTKISVWRFKCLNLIYIKFNCKGLILTLCKKLAASEIKTQLMHILRERTHPCSTESV